MSAKKQDHFLIWRHVYEVSESISGAVERGASNLDELEGQLLAIQEVFQNEVDPYDDFESSVLVHLCGSIRSALEFARLQKASAQTTMDRAGSKQ